MGNAVLPAHQQPGNRAMAQHAPVIHRMPLMQAGQHGGGGGLAVAAAPGKPGGAIPHAPMPGDPAAAAWPYPQHGWVPHPGGHFHVGHLHGPHFSGPGHPPPPHHVHPMHGGQGPPPGGFWVAPPFQHAHPAYAPAARRGPPDA